MFVASTRNIGDRQWLLRDGCKDFPMKNMMLKHCAMALGLSLLPLAAQAGPSASKDLKITLLEVGGNVVGTASGSADTSALTLDGSTQNIPVLSHYGGTSGDILLGSPAALFPYYSGLTQISGTGSIFQPSSQQYFADSYSGDLVLLWVDTSAGFRVGFDNSYVSGASLSASNTWNSKTLASLGLNTGTWKWGYGTAGDTVTLQIGSSGGTTGGGGAVPEPGEWAAMGILGAGLTGLVLRKRRAK
jgi:hypothetical protein